MILVYGNILKVLEIHGLNNKYTCCQKYLCPLISGQLHWQPENSPKTGLFWEKMLGHFHAIFQAICRLFLWAIFCPQTAKNSLKIGLNSLKGAQKCPQTGCISGHFQAIFPAKIGPKIYLKTAPKGLKLAQKTSENILKNGCGKGQLVVRFAGSLNLQNWSNQFRWTGLNRQHPTFAFNSLSRSVIKFLPSIRHLYSWLQ